MDPVVLLLIAGLLLFILLVAILGTLWYLRRQSGGQDAPKEPAGKPKKASGKKKPARPAAEQPTDEAQGDNGQPAPAAPAAPAAGAPAKPATPIKPSAENATGDKIRILIVDDNPGTRDNVSRLLYFEDDLEVIGQAHNGRAGVEMAVELKPHIVLMDINMPDMDGITATKEMSVKAPYSQVVIMSVQSDQHYMKQAMAAGARDFQPKPFTSDELVSCLRRVYNIGLPMYRQYEAIEHAKTQKKSAQPQSADGRKHEQEAPVIAVYSPKGGVGASAIAANLAVALHQQVGDVVLMDGSFQFGDILVHLNTRPTRTVSDLIHEGVLEADLLLDVVLPHESGLKLLLAPPQPQLADFITEGMIKEIVKGLKEQFKAVVVDTTSQLTDRTLSILEAADYILVVGIPELPSIKSMKLFLEVAGQLDFNPERLLVAINKANQPGGIPPGKIKEVLKLKKAYLVPYDSKLHFSLSRGSSVVQQDASAPSSRAIMEMASQIWQTINESGPVAVKEVA